MISQLRSLLVKPRQRANLLGIVLALSILTVILVLSIQKPVDPVWERIQASGTLRVGMDAAYPPFEDIDPNTSQISGFDVDLAHEIGQRLGFAVAFENIAYDGLYDSLQVGGVDVLISALADGPQVGGRASFSLPYFNAGEIIVAPSNSRISRMEDLEGHTVAVEYGSGGDVEARRWERRLADLSILRYPDPGSALNAVLSGEADAALIDGIAARLGVGQHPELALGAHTTDTLYAVAIPSDSPILLESFNDTINEMFEDGTLDRLVEKWFGEQRYIEGVDE